MAKRMVMYAAVAFCLRGLFVAVPVISIDEAVWMTGARIWTGGGVPYLDFVDTKPPVIFAFYALTAWMGELAIPALRVLCILLLVLSASMADRIVALLSARPVSGVPAGLLLLLGLTLGMERQTQFVSTELVCACLFMGSLWLIATAGPGAHLRLALAGALAILIPFTRIPAAVLGLPLAAVLVVCGELRSLAVRLLLFVSGGAVALVLLLTLMGDAGALREMVFWSWTANQLYVDVGPSAAVSARRFLSNVAPAFAITLPLWALAGASILRQQGKARWISAALLAAAMLSLAAAAAGGRWLGHYYLQVIPPLVLVAALAPGQERLRAVATAIVAAGALVFTGVGFWRLHLAENTRETRVEVAEAVRFVRDRTRETDRMLVWGYGPDFYERSGRRPATRHLTPATTVTGYSFGGAKDFASRMNPQALVLPERWAQFMNDLRCTPPAMIVDFSRYDFHYFGGFGFEHYPELNEWVETSCTEAASDGKAARSFRFLECHATPEPERCRKK